jgi:pimeloyl-ACP methyl ester carboxylesterase
MKRFLPIGGLTLVLISVLLLGAVPPSTAWVTNPTSGTRLFVQIFYPQNSTGGASPALVLVPGGRGDSRTFVRPKRKGPSQVEQFVDAGFVVVVFDPDGRGRSEGTDGDDGFIQQDGLAAVIEYAASLSGVDPQRIGLVSYSYGVTMATGALARHPDLPVLFYIDWEGPADRNDTGGCDEDHLGHLQGHPCDDEAYWSEREAARFALRLPVPYQRVQSAQDHVQPDVDHALLMINNATATEYGGNGISPWTRLNDLSPNAVYSLDDPPPLPPRITDPTQVIVNYAHELLDLFSPEAADEPAESVLLFGIGMHIEPMGAQVSDTALTAGAIPKTTDPRRPDYNRRADFERAAQSILQLAEVVERHGGRLTVQAQSPFTTAAVRFGSSILSSLEARGHEIALHFHEDAHLGKDSEELPPSVWSAVMKEEIGYIHTAGVEGPIRYWSGGNLYPDLLAAASGAGLEINGDWKNPLTQSTDPALVGVNPWRPAGGPSATDLSAFSSHDPQGPIIFLPGGEIDPQKFSHKREIIAKEGDEGWFNVLADQVERSLASARPDRVNVCHFTVHPGEFIGDPNDPFAVLDRFLEEVIDPLVAAGRVRWATFSEMADAYIAWEESHPNVDSR